jgi:hypothetical protein
LDNRLIILKDNHHFYVDIGDNCLLLVTISDKTFEENMSRIDDIKNIVRQLIISLTRRLDIETKNYIVGNKVNYSNQKGDYSLDIYNCDPLMREKKDWGDSNYEYVSDINGWEQLENILTEDGRNYASGTYGLGGTLYVPRTSICIDDIICNGTQSSYLDESILTHEFSHTILELGIREAHPDWYEEFGRITDMYNDIANNKSNGYCPSRYSCDRRELFALASQAWFKLIIRTDINNYITTPEDMRDFSRGTLSLYSFMVRVYGEPSDLCYILPNDCKSKCKNR